MAAGNERDDRAVLPRVDGQHVRPHGIGAGLGEAQRRRRCAEIDLLRHCARGRVATLEIAAVVDVQRAAVGLAGRVGLIDGPHLVRLGECVSQACGEQAAAKYQSLQCRVHGSISSVDGIRTVITPGPRRRRWMRPAKLRDEQFDVNRALPTPQPEARAADEAMTCPAIGRPWNAICHGPAMESPSHPPRAATAGPAQAQPRAVLRLGHAVAIIVGIVIGAGIFKAPAMVAGMAGSPAWMFAAWVLGGLVSLVGALCYAELATTYPHAGGDYHFLRRAYGARLVLPVRLGALFRDHHRLDRAARLRLRRLHDAAPAARAAQLGAVRRRGGRCCSPGSTCAASAPARRRRAGSPCWRWAGCC